MKKLMIAFMAMVVVSTSGIAQTSGVQNKEVPKTHVAQEKKQAKKKMKETKEKTAAVGTMKKDGTAHKSVKENKKHS